MRIMENWRNTKRSVVVSMKNVWLVRGVIDGLERLEIFKKDNIIAIGWPKLPDMKGKSIDNIRDMLKAVYTVYDTSRKIGQDLSIVHTFVNKLQQGDLVLVPAGEQVWIGMIQSDYYHNPIKVIEGYCHQRRVKWLQEKALDSFHGVVRILLKSRKNLARLQNRSDTVWAMVPREQVAVEQTVPSDLSKEASSIDIHKETKKSIIQQLNNQDPAWRLKIALEIMKAKSKL